MVLKHICICASLLLCLRVVLFLDGSQTQVDIIEESVVFEGRVVLDGSQTSSVPSMTLYLFESRVTLVKAQAEANASACFFINSVCADPRAG